MKYQLYRLVNVNIQKKIGKKMTDLIYVSDAIRDNPRLVFDLASQLEESVFNPITDDAPQ